MISFSVWYRKNEMNDELYLYDIFTELLFDKNIIIIIYLY